VPTASELTAVTRLDNSDPIAVATAAEGAWKMLDSAGAPIVIASTNDPFADRIADEVEARTGAEVLRITADVAPAIGTHLDAHAKTGQDRLLNAAAAWSCVKQACVVVDAGTAITVDFIDGVGTFQGGAIAPGAQMALRAMHQHTAALPSITYREPDAGTFGKNTEQAMLQGVHVGLQGLVWKLVEQYAMQYGAFPVVLATGGDAATLFAKDELVNAIVPDLTLHGIHESWRAAYESESEPSRPAVQRASAVADVRPGGCGDGCGCHAKHDDHA
jgi:type III pantothenate kinase